MSNSCSVADCPNWQKKNGPDLRISYHRFPKDKKLENVWIIKCKRQDRFDPEKLKASLHIFQKGLLMSIKSLISLHADLKARGFKYILTHRLNQNALESVFSRIRALCGQNENPNPIDFIHRLKLLILGSELPLPIGCNVQELDPEEIFVTGSVLNFTKKDQKDSQKTLEELAIQEEELKPHIEHIENLLYEDDEDDRPRTRTSGEEALRYIAGYLAFKFPDQKYGTPSGQLDNSEISSSSSKSWIEILTRGGLMIPTDELVDLVKICDRVFVEEFDVNRKKG